MLHAHTRPSWCGGMTEDHMKKPTKEQMEHIEKNCGDKPCEEVCGKLGIWYCPLK